MDSLEKWVNEAQPDRVDFRQAVHLILHAIRIDDDLRSNMVMKGGMLLGIQHGNSRHTEDIDFSTERESVELDEFKELLNDSLVIAADELPYTLACLVQSANLQPRKGGKFPSFKITVGYANTLNKGALKRLREGHSPSVIKIDYSLNEKSYNTEKIIVSEGEEHLVAYSVIDILAEKLRSLIQQVIRKRNRRQDVYDIWHLLGQYNFSDSDLDEILSSFKKKSLDRVPNEYIEKNVFQRGEIIKASQSDYAVLVEEIEGELPPFEEAYERMRLFFESLPWN